MRRRAVLGALVMTVALGVGATPALASPVIAGADEIVQATKKTGAGAHPALRWKKVAGATEYLVVVQTPKKEPYWAWQGVDTSVRLGGGPFDAPETSDGASLTKKLVWFVIAFDADGTVVASSERRSIAP